MVCIWKFCDWTFCVQMFCNLEHGELNIIYLFSRTLIHRAQIYTTPARARCDASLLGDCLSLSAVSSQNTQVIVCECLGAAQIKMALQPKRVSRCEQRLTQGIMKCKYSTAVEYNIIWYDCSIIIMTCLLLPWLWSMIMKNDYDMWLWFWSLHHQIVVKLENEWYRTGGSHGRRSWTRRR